MTLDCITRRIKEPLIVTRYALFALVPVLLAPTSVLQSQETADQATCSAWQPQEIRLVAEKVHPWWFNPRNGKI